MKSPEWFSAEFLILDGQHNSSSTTVLATEMPANVKYDQNTELKKKERNKKEQTD